MKKPAKRTLLKILVGILIFSPINQIAFADEISELKKVIFSDCNKATGLIVNLPAEKRKTAISFLESVITLSTALEQPMLQAPFFGPPITEEPKIGELVAIGSINRDTQAKSCALNLIPLLFPDSHELLSALLTAYANASFPQELTAKLSENISTWASQCKSSEIKLELMSQAISHLANNFSNAAAQNILFEIADSDLLLFYEELSKYRNKLSLEQIRLLLTVIDPGYKSSKQILKNLVFSGPDQRLLSIQLLKELYSKEELSEDHQWVLKVITFAASKEIGELLKSFNLRSNDQDVLLNLLKGADEEDRDWILLLLELFKPLSPVSEDLLIRRALTLDTAPNLELEHSIIKVAGSIKTAENRKKWSKFVERTFLKIINDSRITETFYLQLLSNYKVELKDIIAKEIKKDKNPHLLWLSPYLNWSELNEYSTKDIINITQNFWKHFTPTTSLTQQLDKQLQEEVVSAVDKLNWEQKKKLIEPLKNIINDKSSNSSQKSLSAYLISIIDPHKLTKTQLKELTLDSRCRFAINDTIMQLSGVLAREFYGNLLNCFQNNDLNKDDLKTFFGRQAFPGEHKQEIFINAINNPLFDRSFKAFILPQAKILNIGLNSIEAQFIQLLNDNNPKIQLDALSAASWYVSDSAQALTLFNPIRSIAQSSATTNENRAYALLALTKLAIYLDEGLQNDAKNELKSALSNPEKAQQIMIIQDQFAPEILNTVLLESINDLPPESNILAISRLIKDSSASEYVKIIDADTINKLNRLKIDKIREAAKLLKVLSLAHQGDRAEYINTLRSVLFNNERWLLIESQNKHLIPKLYIEELKDQLCPQNKTGCGVLGLID